MFHNACAQTCQINDFSESLRSLITIKNSKDDGTRTWLLGALAPPATMTVHE